MLTTTRVLSRVTSKKCFPRTNYTRSNRLLGTMALTWDDIRSRKAKIKEELFTFETSAEMIRDNGVDVRMSDVHLCMLWKLVSISQKSTKGIFTDSWWFPIFLAL